MEYLSRIYFILNILRRSLRNLTYVKELMAHSAQCLFLCTYFFCSYLVVIRTVNLKREGCVASFFMYRRIISSEYDRVKYYNTRCNYFLRLLQLASYSLNLFPRLSHLNSIRIVLRDTI